MVDIYLIRHAESEMNTQLHLVGGRSNKTPLSKKGMSQSLDLGEGIKREGIVFDGIYSSTATRTLETTGLVGSIAGFSLESVIKTPLLLEIDQGEGEGKERSQVYTPEVLKLIHEDPWNFALPRGESQRDVEVRMLNWIESILPNYSNNQKVAVFTHGMSIKCLLRGLMGFHTSMTYKLSLDNTSITKLKHNENGWHLITLNDTAHLQNKCAISKQDNQ